MTAPCPHHLGRLPCTRPAAEHPDQRGHIFHASDAPDRRHDDEITQETA